MSNIRHLFPGNDELFHIDTSGNIIFGMILRSSSNGKDGTINRNSPVGQSKVKYISHNSWAFKNAHFDNLEECLRCVWANLVATGMSAFRNREDIYHMLYDDKKYWNEHYTLWQILKKEVPNVIDSEITVSNEISKINQWLTNIGLNLNYWYNDKRYYYTCTINRVFEMSEVFKELSELVKVYDSNFNYVYVDDTVNKVNHFPIKTMDVKNEVHKNLRKMNFLKIHGSESKEIRNLFILCYRYYVDVMFKYMDQENAPGLTLRDFYDLIAKTLTLGYNSINYLKNHHPDLLDRYKKVISDDNLNNGATMGEMGFED